MAWKIEEKIVFKSTFKLTPNNNQTGSSMLRKTGEE